jgi:hypothetical protein
MSFSIQLELFLSCKDELKDLRRADNPDLVAVLFHAV